MCHRVQCSVGSSSAQCYFVVGYLMKLLVKQNMCINEMTVATYLKKQKLN